MMFALLLSFYDLSYKLILRDYWKLLFPLKSLTNNERDLNKLNYIKLLLPFLISLIAAFFDGSVATFLDIIIDQNSNSTHLFQCVDGTECHICNATTIYQCLYHIPNCTLSFIKVDGSISMWFEIFLKCYTLEYKTSCQSTTFGLPFVYWRDGTYTSFKLDTYVFILIY